LFHSLFLVLHARFEWGECEIHLAAALTTASPELDTERDKRSAQPQGNSLTKSDVIRARNPRQAISRRLIQQLLVPGTTLTTGYVHPDI
jgi:hypothetical protein